ncbi:MAG: PorT family protein [Prevotella sp.]|nr:PorT family protein [Prevotella sp.]
MMKYRNLGFRASFVLIFLCLLGFNAKGADFIDTSIPDEPFNLGVRIGINTSNRTLNKDIFDRWNKNSWGTGFDLGVVADINIRNYIALQPGLFFQTRSGDFTYVNSVTSTAAALPARVQSVKSEMVQYGHCRSYSFYIPVLCSVRFNLSDDVRWSVDLGPYMAFTLKNDFDKAMYIPDTLNPQFHEVKPAGVDVGAKMGMGLNIKEHYYIGIHYLAGGLSPWKDSNLGGKNKAWSFTVGYDF